MNTPSLIAVLSGGSAALASLLFAYLPGLKGWFRTKPGEYKALFMLALIVVVALASVGAGCANMFAAIAVDCSRSGVETVVTALFSVLVAAAGSQATYMIGVRPFKDSAEIEAD